MNGTWHSINAGLVVKIPWGGRARARATWWNFHYFSLKWLSSQTLLREDWPCCRRWWQWRGFLRVCTPWWRPPPLCGAGPTYPRHPRKCSWSRTWWTCCCPPGPCPPSWVGCRWWPKRGIAGCRVLQTTIILLESRPWEFLPEAQCPSIRLSKFDDVVKLPTWYAPVP